MCKEKIKKHKKDYFTKKNYYKKTRKIKKIKIIYLIIIIICLSSCGYIIYKTGIHEVFNSFKNFTNIQIYDYKRKEKAGKQETDKVLSAFKTKEIADGINEKNIQITSVKYLEFTYEDSNFVIIDYNILDDNNNIVLQSTVAYKNNEFYADLKDLKIIINEENGISKFEEKEKKSKAQLLEQIIKDNKNKLINI